MNSLLGWLVVWTVVSLQPVPCPDFKPDPYTGEYPGTHCAVYHTETIERDMEEWFKTKEEAKEFIKNAPEHIRKDMVLSEVK